MTQGNENAYPPEQSEDGADELYKELWQLFMKQYDQEEFTYEAKKSFTITKRKQQSTDDELWDEVLHIIGAYKPAFTNEIEILKKSFYITRK